jgi:hypothetical protein
MIVRVAPENSRMSGASAVVTTPALLKQVATLEQSNNPQRSLDTEVVASNAALSATFSTATKSHTSQSLDATGAIGSAHCLTTPADNQIEIRDGFGVPAEVLSETLLEHPAIPGLWLTRSQRLFIGRLEYRNAAGNECIEKGMEMVNRKEWKQPVPRSVGRTSGDFVELDMSIIGRRRNTD